MGCQLTATEIANFVGGQLNGIQDKICNGVSTDTRSDLNGKLFIALKGERFDAHDFCADAAKAGASILIVNKNFQASPEILKTCAVISVGDTLKALQALASAWRKKLIAQIVGITGSNGKSSTKDFCYQILKDYRRVHVAQKSFNNHIGVPLTLLGAPLDSEVVLVEMGMNHSGELTALSKIAEPDIVMCTMVGRGHVGNFENGIDGVAAAKEEIYLANPKALKIFNYDNEYTLKMFERAQSMYPSESIKAFSSFSAGAEVSFRASRMTMTSLHITGHIAGISSEVDVPVFGRHNVINLMAAATVAMVLGMAPEDIWSALPNCRSGWGRNQLFKLPSGVWVLFDGYNANPDSLTALLKNIFEVELTEGRKVAVIGEMLELGEGSAKLHEELGELAGQVGLELIWFFGPSCKAFEAGAKKSGFDKNLIISDTYKDSLALKVQSMLNPKDVVVLKGSRGSQVERVLAAWDPGFAKNN